MKVTTETVAPREVVLTIEPDSQTIQRAMRRAAREISRYRPIAGFRPGKAPYGMVERMYGREVILNEALNTIAPDIYREAINEADVEPLEQGMLDVESEDPLVLKVSVPLVPKVTLGEYQELSITPEPEVAVSEEDIEEQIEMLRRQHAEAEPVERPLEMGDQVVAKIVGTVDGEEVLRHDNITIVVSEDLDPPGFAEALLGSQVDDIREFSLFYPDDHENEELAGQKVDYQVAIGAIRELNLPDLDDEFAKTVGDFETLAELSDRIAENLQAQREQEATAAERERAITALVEVSEVEYPAASVDHELDHLMDRQRQRMQQMGFSLEAYLRMRGQSEDELREELRESAEHGLVQRLVLLEYARDAGLELTKEEMNAALGTFADSVSDTYGEQATEIIQQAFRGGAVSGILQEGLLNKAAQHLTDRLAGREPSVETAEPVDEAGPESEADDDQSDEAPAEEFEQESAE